VNVVESTDCECSGRYRLRIWWKVQIVNVVEGTDCEFGGSYRL